MVKVVVCGYGEAGIKHYNCWRNIDHISVSTVDSDPGRGADITSNFFEFIELHARNIDILDICLPHNLHAAAALKAEEYCIPYLVEKPLAMNLQDAQKIAQVNSKSRLPAMVAENWLYTPVIQEMMKYRELGIGRPTWFRGHLEFEPSEGRKWYWDPSIAGGGVLLSSGVHLFSVARRILGEPINIAWAKVLSQSNVENGVVVALEFPRSLGLFTISREVPRASAVYECSLIGENGTMDCNLKKGILSIQSKVEAKTLTFAPSMGMQEELNYFITNYRNGTSLLTSPENEVGSIQIIDKIYKYLHI